MPEFKFDKSKFVVAPFAFWDNICFPAMSNRSILEMVSFAEMVTKLAVGFGKIDSLVALKSAVFRNELLIMAKGEKLLTPVTLYVYGFVPAKVPVNISHYVPL